MLGVRINRKFLYFSICFITFARFMTHILCLSNSFWVKLLRITMFTRQLYIASYDKLNFEIALNDLLLRSDLTTMITTMTSEKVSTACFIMSLLPRSSIQRRNQERGPGRPTSLFDKGQGTQRRCQYCYREQAPISLTSPNSSLPSGLTLKPPHQYSLMLVYAIDHIFVHQISESFLQHCISQRIFFVSN